jgi:hypothetical protein
VGGFVGVIVGEGEGVGWAEGLGEGGIVGDVVGDGENVGVKVGCGVTRGRGGTVACVITQDTVIKRETVSTAAVRKAVNGLE